MVRKPKEKADQPLGMHVTPSLYARFDAICKEQNCSQPSALSLLIDVYNNHKDKPLGVSPIHLSMYCDSQLTGKSPVRSIRFYGRVEHEPEQTLSPISRDCLETLLAQELHKRILVDFPPGGPFILQHKLNLYFNNDEQRYIVQECMYIYHELRLYEHDNPFPRVNSIPLLDLKRCRFVNHFDDIYRYFGKYSTTAELEAISHIIPNDIGKDYHLMDELF